jgi:hypothetical protein
LINEAEESVGRGRRSYGVQRRCRSSAVGWEGDGAPSSGLRIDRAEFRDVTGRPIAILSEGEPIRELV